MNEVIQYTVVLPEASLLLGKKTLQLERPHEVSVDRGTPSFYRNSWLMVQV